MLRYDEFILNSKAYKLVELDKSQARICHAYMFVAKDNNYLTRFCELVSRLLICDKEEHNETLRIEKRSHPDVLFYGENENLTVDDVSKIIEQSQIKPFEADKKIFVFCNAGNMNEACQNKLLKSIEEPPENTYYVFACSDTNRILQTVLSRVKMVELDELSPSTILGMLESAGVESEKAEIYSTCAGGDASFAERLVVDDGFVDFFNQIVSCFYEIKGSRDVLKFSSKFTEKNVDKDEFVDIFMLISRDLLMIISNKEEYVNLKNVLPKLKVVANTLSANAVSELIKTCVKAKQQLYFNVSGTSVVDEVLFKLAEVKVKCRK